MCHANRITRRNDRTKIIAMSLIGFGCCLIVLAAIYILNAPTVSILATEDVMTKWIGANAYEIGWIGACSIILGTLFKWRSEDSQEALEKTTRFIDFDEVKERQAERR